VTSITSLPGKSAADFLRAAVRFANENLWGTLGVNLIIHPQTMKELGPVLDEAISAESSSWGDAFFAEACVVRHQQAGGCDWAKVYEVRGATRVCKVA
jgi:hypothetical protein